MASTPDTSFSSEDFENRRRATKARGRPTPFRLPSPQSDAHASEQEEPKARCSDDDDDDDADEASDEVQRAYDAIWDSFCGLPTPAREDPTFYLGHQEAYERLYELLDSHHGLLPYFEDELRKSWDAEAGTLTLHLVPPALVHEYVKEQLARAIDTELDRIEHEIPALRPLCSKMFGFGNARVRRRTRTARAPDFERSPDGQIRYQGARYPPFIFEVAYSQEDDRLSGATHQFFEKLPGRICTILAVDIKYADEAKRTAPGHHHAATVSLWTSQVQDDTLVIRSVVNATAFRGEDGRARPGEILIPFEYFLPVQEREGIPPEVRAEVRLSFADLQSFVQIGEQEQRTEDKSVSPEPRPQLKRIRFEDEQGAVIKEKAVSKRQKIAGPGTRSRTRSGDQPRRSDRLRSRSAGPSRDAAV